MDLFCIIFMLKNVNVWKIFVVVIYFWLQFYVKFLIVNFNFLLVKVSYIKVIKILNIVSVVDLLKIMLVVVNVNIDDKFEDYFLCEVLNLKEFD